MATKEIYSFVQKFQELRSAGYCAHLDLDTHAGKAWVGLRLHLDDVPCHPHQQAYYQKPFSASRHRRREQRAAARAANINAEKASETATNICEEMTNTSDKVINECVENENQVNENKENEAEEAVDPVPENEVNTCIEDVGNENSKIDDENDSLVEKNVDEENSKATNTAPAEPCPTEIIVYGTATLENCPDAEINKDYGESIRRFLSSEPHLVQNISSINLQHVSSRSFRNSTHTHTVSVTMHVRTARLWESPASYVRKHLGFENYWERSNGTTIKLSRIHQK